jgi:non-ribosomal peptide synthetase component F/acyl carrier protein
MASRDLTREITIASDQYVKEENYWLDKLSGELVKSYFPYVFNLDKDKQACAEAAFDTVKFGIEGELFTKLMALSSGAEKVLHLVLTAGVVLLLNKYSYDAGDDVIVGVPIYKQNIKGDFINTMLALRIQLEEGITFKELLIQVKQVFIAANDTWKRRQQKQAPFAYVIFTSGSMGKPKGTLLYQSGIINHTFTKIMELEAGAEDVFYHNLNIVFVASIWQFFAPLFAGSRLHIYPEDILASPYEFFTRVENDCVTFVEVVPSLLKVYLQLLEEGKQEVNLDSLRIMVLTGEKVTLLLVNRFYRQYHIPLMNAYGQSECLDDTLHYNIPYNVATRIVPVGRQSNYTQVYILGETGELQPTGGKGELHISGDGLAPGYLNRPELTAENFVDIPFKIKQKLYKTGDLARWLLGRFVEFLGRRDHQVKIRGNLVALEEIESRLLKHGGIKDVVLQAREDEKGDTYLCAYIVSIAVGDNLNNNKAGVNTWVAGLREYLSGELPFYMIPTYFVQLEEIPLTPSGKVDRKALPEPDTADTGRMMVYAAPGDEVEKKLVEIWSEVLLLEKDSIGIDDVFSQLGGNSLNSTIIAARVHKAFNIKLEVTRIFKTPTIRGLARYIKEAPRDVYTSIEPVEEKEYYNLSPAQKRLYILHQMDPESTVYNMPAIQMVTGRINKDKLKDVSRRLIHRHTSLRSSFTIIDEEPVQRVYKQVEFEIEHYRTGHAEKSIENSSESGYLPLELEKMIKDFITPFNLAQVPLLRAGLIELSGEEKYLLVVDMHHIISDGTSLGIIVRDFMALYFGEELPVLPLQYRDYAEWQNKEKQKEIVKKQERFWLNEFKGEIPVLDLPLDYLRPRLQSFEGNWISFEIEAKETARLNRLAESQGATFFMVLLAAFNILLAKLSNQEDIIVGSPTVGHRHADLDNIMGMFVNTLALRNYPVKEKVFEEFLEELKKGVWGALENQDYPFEDLIDKLSMVQDTGRNPLFDAACALNNIIGKTTIDSLDDDAPPVSTGDFLFEKSDDVTATLTAAASSTTKFDFYLMGVEAEDRLLFTFQYCTKLFKQETVERYVKYFKEIICIVARDRDILLEDILISHDLLAPARFAVEEEEGDFGF